MFDVRQTAEFSRWLATLKDLIARAAIVARLRRLSLGNPGDVRSVGEGVSELRIDVGPGYRAYYLRVAQLVVLMLAGGDKSSQDRDIRRVLDMARDIRAAEKAAKAKASKPRKPK
jgi:putative addiction module killer protein